MIERSGKGGGGGKAEKCPRIIRVLGQGERE